MKVFQINLTEVDQIFIKLIAVDKNNNEIYRYENPEGINTDHQSMKLLGLTTRKNTRFIKAQDIQCNGQKLIKWVEKRAELLIIDFFNDEKYLGYVVVNKLLLDSSYLPLPARQDFYYTHQMAKTDKKIQGIIKYPEVYHLNGQRLIDHPKFRHANRLEIKDTYFY